MKKIFVLSILAICLMSCTSDNYFDIEEIHQVEVPQKAKKHHKNIFKDIYTIIISANKDFDYFREVLPKHLLKKIDKGNYNEAEAVETIWRWYENDMCYDVMCEMPEWDDFLPNLPDKYFEKYHWEY